MQIKNIIALQEPLANVYNEIFRVKTSDKVFIVLELTISKEGRIEYTYSLLTLKELAKTIIEISAVSDINKKPLLTENEVAMYSYIFSLRKIYNQIAKQVDNFAVVISFMFETEGFSQTIILNCDQQQFIDSIIKQIEEYFL